MVPKEIRDRHNLYAGARLEIEDSVDAIHLIPADAGSSLVERDGVLVHHGGTIADINVVEHIRSQRDRRIGRTVAGRLDR